MAGNELSARESLHWFEWLGLVRCPLLLGIGACALAAPCLLYVDLPLHRTTSVAVLVVSVTAPCILLGLLLARSVSLAGAIAGTLREREQQLAATRKLLGRGPGGAARSRPPSGSGAGAEPPERTAARDASEREQDALGRAAREMSAPLHIVQAHLALLTEAFGDILPVLDQHAAARRDLRIARLDYPFFRAQVPVLMRDMGNAVVQLRAVLRDATSPAPRPMPAVSGRSPTRADLETRAAPDEQQI